MRPLEGIRIIDLSMGWAGPLACRHMADLGAEVIKVESCVRFDWWRSWEATPEWIEDDGAEKSSAFNMVNRNKMAITLELDVPQGRELLLQLVADANAVVENFSGGVLRKLDLEYEVLKAANEKIILLSMQPFGATGPWSEFRAYGSTVEQSSGLPHLNGMPQDLPVMQHVALGDAVGGITGAQALLAALRHQHRTGEGQRVDLSQTEGLFPLASHGILHVTATGREPERGTDDLASMLHSGVYPCAGEDEWIVIEISEPSQWRALAQALDLPDDFADSETPEARVKRQETLARCTAERSAFELMQALQTLGVPATRTFSYGELLQHPHLNSRNFWQWRERAVVGNQPNPSAPYRYGEDPLPVRNPAPTLGQHNVEVFTQQLGLAQEEIDQLAERGVIGWRPRMPD